MSDEFSEKLPERVAEPAKAVAESMRRVARAFHIASLHLHISGDDAEKAKRLGAMVRAEIEAMKKPPEDQ